MTSLETVYDLVQTSRAFEQEGKFPAALKRAQRALAVAREMGDLAAEAEALVCLAKIRFRMGKISEAVSLAQEARALAQADSPTIVDTWQVSGNCAAGTDSLAEAEACYLQAAELAREIGYSQGRIAALHGLAAGVYRARGQFDLALAAELEVRDLLEQEGRKADLIYPLIITIMIYQFTGQYEKVPGLLNELGALTLPGSIPEGYQLFLQAEHALAQGNLEEAKSLYLHCRSNAEATGEPWLNINLRLGMSRYYRMTDEGATARQWAEDAFQYAAKVGFRHEQGRARLERGQVAWLCGQMEQAHEDFQAAIALLEELGAAYDLAHARLLLAALLNAQKDRQAHLAWRAAAGAILAGGYAFLLQRERRHAFPLVAEYLNHPDQELAELSAQLLAELQKNPAPPLSVRLLGDFAVLRGRQPVSAALLKQRQAGELFRLLLISPGRRLSREQVIEALWQDKSPAAAVNFFHQATSALRHALEPDLPGKFPSRYLLVEEGLVSLRLPPGSEVDYERFEQHLKRGEWQQAVSLWQGEPFSLDRYKDWAAWKREQLINGYLRALLALAEEYLSSGNAQDALDACQRILQIDPWQEQAAQIAMQACLQQGNRSQALRIYLNLERRLRDDLGIAPQDDLRRLYLSLLK